jgi:carboxymethylenebutenolidase
MASFWEIQRVEAEGEHLLEDMATYVSQPNLPGRAPAVIVIQEAFGVNKHTQDVCDRFAAEGYFAVAPAMFHREGINEETRGTNPVYGYGDMDDVRAAMGNLNDENIIRDINTTVAWLNRHPRVDGSRIGIVGFCMGGRVTYLAAAACPGIGAASVFYGGGIMAPAPGGGPPTPFERSAGIQCPVMGNFGETDQNPTPANVQTIQAELQRLGKAVDFKMYPGAGHGFFCDDRASYHEASARDAWTRTLDWFNRHLAAVAATA